MRRHRDVAAMVRSSTSSDRSIRICNFPISGQCVICTVVTGFFLLLVGTFLAIFSIEGQHSHRLRHTMGMVKVISYSLIGLGAGIAMSACGLYAIAINLGRVDAEEEDEYRDTQRIVSRSISEEVEASSSVGNIQHSSGVIKHVSWDDSVINNERRN